MHPIDLIVPWVDGTDPVWQAEKAKYAPAPRGDDRVIRYRSWDHFRYFFRGVEQNLPWVRTVHFVTWGHLPAWLNAAHPKLHIVRHTDYIPPAYLPTFSANPIELNLHRIEGLAEHFIFANDDTFFLRPLEPDFFFKNGLPADSAIQNVLQFKARDGIDHIVANDLTLLNSHFSKKECIQKNRGKWFSPRYKRGALQNLYLQRFTNFTGFLDPHMPNAFLKRTFEAVWAAEPDYLDNVCRSRVRSYGDVNQWLMRYWQLAAGDFIPTAPNRGRLFAIGRDDAAIETAVKTAAFPMLCLSDHDETVDFEREDRFISALLGGRFPAPSAFERASENGDRT